jgi:uncharacterized membrane protein HdeD (DUF308 family)
MSIDSGKLQQAVAQSIRDHWVLFLVEGVILVILGVLAIVIPPIATLAVTILIGWLFIVSGIVGLVTTFMARQAPGFWWSLLSAVVAIAAGVLLLVWPLSGVLTLTLLLIVFFTIEGVLSGRWGWMLASGIIDLVLAAIILAGLPGTAAWAIGLLVGINLLFGGVSMIAMALHAKSEAPTAAKAA